MIKKTIQEYYLLTTLLSIAKAITMATYVTFLQTKGLNLFEVNMTNVVFFVTLAICEIPTGAFADVFGRKVSFIISCLLYAIGSFVYAGSDSFAGFATAEFISAIGITFASGAFRAWFVDKLIHHGYKESLHTIFARANQINHVTRIIGALIGAYLANIAIGLPWFVSGVCFLICLLVALPLKEEYFVRQKFSFRKGLRSMKETTMASIRFSRNDARIRFIMTLVFVHVFSIQALNMQWQPFFRPWVSNITSFGFIFTGISISLMIGAWISPRLLRKFSCERKTLLVCQIGIAVGIILAGLVPWFPFALCAFFFHEIARGAFTPIKEAYMHNELPSKERATIESFESILHHVGGTIGLIVSGVMAQMFGISLTWTVIGVIFLAFSLTATRRENQRKIG